MGLVEMIARNEATCSDQRRALLEMLHRIPASDAFARMLVVGKINALDRGGKAPQPQGSQK